MKKTVLHISKWLVFTPLILLAGCLQLEDLVLLFKDMRANRQHEGDELLARIERIRN
ncbi:hypothetical protein [Paenibacillus campi]|uniref:hypothetical protein n=1 Tax=Paenibacillus campi TaxID=3106031 RepID=UPI002AFFF6C9|nr:MULTISPECIES: hypothetical protein [unclassified Paenibacillus]